MVKEYNKNDMRFYALHNDLTHIGADLYGSKAIMAKEYCKIYPQGIVTCGSRFSIQVLMFARTCQFLNVPCVVCIPAGQDTDMTLKLKETNVQIEYIRPGYNTVLNARAREKATELGYGYVPLGMLEEIAYQTVANLVLENAESIKKASRIVIPVGSGTTLIGVVYGLKKAGINKPVLGVMVGMDATKNIFEKACTFTQNYDIMLVRSEISYDTEVDNDIIPTLNKTYEAKCLDYLQDNDLLWIV